MTFIPWVYLVMILCPNIDALEELPVLEALRESPDQRIFSFTQQRQRAPDYRVIKVGRGFDIPRRLGKFHEGMAAGKTDLPLALHNVRSSC